MRRKKIAAALVIAAALSLAACSNSPQSDADPSESVSSETTAAAEPSGTETSRAEASKALKESAVDTEAESASDAPKVSDLPELTEPETSSVEAPEAPQPAEYAEVFSGFEQTESGAYRILTNHDPKNCAEITLDGFRISVKANYENSNVWAINGHRLNARGEVSFRESASSGELVPIYLYQEEGPRKGSYYCAVIYVYADKNGLVLPDSSENALRNAEVSAVVTALPQQGVEAYIDASGDKQKIAQTLAEVKALGDELCAGLDSDYDKLRAITMWVRENIYYDFDACETEVTPETVSLSQVLELKRSVCGGYSNLVAALCASQGITCYNLRGTAESRGLPYDNSAANPELHEWNLAVIDGRKIWVDAGFCTTNAYRGGEYTEGHLSLDYFDITDDLFAVDHRAEYCEYRDYFAKD